MLRLLPLFCLSYFALLVPAQATEAALQIDFYTERISLGYDTDLLLPAEVRAEEAAMVQAYRTLEQRNYRSLLQNLQNERTRLQLNDWLYYRLLRDAVSAIYPSNRPIARELAIWFFISKSGYDTRITYRDRDVSLYVYTTDEIFEAPLIKDGQRTYVSLTGLATRQLSRRSLYMLEYAPNKSGRAFSFDLPAWPRLLPRLEKRTVSFPYAGEVYEFSVSIDRNIAAIMEDYPYISEAQYLRAPLSPVLAASLLPTLERFLIGKNERQKIELLVSLTRSAFLYKEDKEFFGKSKPMVADEVFCYPYSDCEDRAALFQALVKELLHLPTIAIAYDDHLSVGVATEQVTGDAIKYEGRNYVVCDPTGPSNSSRIGLLPEGYEKKSFEIVYATN